MIVLYEPELHDLWFRQKMMADEETMSYNHAWGGTIPFPESRWKTWYDHWLVHHEDKRFYRYLRDSETDQWIIDGNYRRTLALRFERCTEVFLFNLSVEECLEGAASRSGKVREDMPWMEQEFDPEYRQHILDFQKDQMPRINGLIDQYRDSRKITVFYSQEEAGVYLKNPLKMQQKL